MNDVETMIRESMGYRGDLRPLHPEPLIRVARRHRRVRRVGAGVVVGAALALGAGAMFWVHPPTEPSGVDSTTSPTAAGSQGTSDDLASADDVQKQAFDDGRVTRDEYRTGFERYRGCLSKQGYDMVSINRTGRLIDYGVPSEAAASGVDQACYARHFKAVDMAWQLADDKEPPQQ